VTRDPFYQFDNSTPEKLDFDKFDKNLAEIELFCEGTTTFRVMSRLNNCLGDE
jgi:hypothetical protein